MFSSKSCNYIKLRTNLRLVINRLKLLEKKKTELALKARKEIADYISIAKEDRARIRVEHIVREDYLVEAMEIIEMYCDLLLARFGLIEKMKEMDAGLEEAIATIIWITPRLSADIPEMREIQKQLTNKYGKEYADMCMKNEFENVNEKVMHKMSIAAPPKILIENYMVEIAKTYKVPFEPDPTVMLDEPPEVNDLIDLMGAGAAHRGASAATAQESHDNEMNEKKRPPSPPGWHSGAGGGGSGGGGGGIPVMHPSQAHHMPPGPANYMPLDPGPVPPYEPPGAGSAFAGGIAHTAPPPLPQQPPNAGAGSAGPHPNPQSLPPYDTVAPPHGPGQHPSAPAPAPRNLGPPKPARGASPLPNLPDVPDLPGLPSVPSSTIGASSAGGDDVDFDDLTKRFEDLKRRK